MGHRLLIEVTLLVAASLLVAGCAGGDGKRAAEEYPGEFREFDLYLFQITSKGTSGWSLYPGAYVDVWAWALDDPIAAKATVPGPTLRVREHDTVRVNFHIQGAPMAHTIHWHGIHLPWNMDGVPYVSQLPIGDKNFDGHGSLFTYEFKVEQSGTYWYHCHVDTAHHLDMGMYGALIVDPADPEQDPAYEREEVLMLDEWDRSHAHQNTDAIAAANSVVSKSGDPRVTANDVYAYIRDYLIMNNYYNETVRQPVVQNMPGLRETRSWYPITYAPYFAEYDTYLINGKAFPDTPAMFIKTGETLRIRLINAGELVHSMHLHGHHFLVTHKDGFLLPAPYYADTVLIGPGERYDVYVKGNNPGPWHFHDHISLHEQNDYIHPGGMMTMLCYEDGWEKADLCKDGHKIHLQGGDFTSGTIVQVMDGYLRKLAGVGPVGGTSGVLTSNGANGGLSPFPSVPGSGAPAPTSSGPGVPLPSVPVQHIH